MRQHPSFQSRMRRATTEPTGQEPIPEPDVSYTTEARYAGRACCCAAHPAVIVVLPPAAGRPDATDLLLCGHHYRVSRPTLAALRATPFDISGHPLTAGEWPDPA